MATQAVNPFRGADNAVAEALRRGGNLAGLPVDIADHLISQLANQRIQVQEETKREMPSLGKVALKIKDTVKRFHLQIGVDGARFSEYVAVGAKTTLRIVFTPLAFCQTGETLREIISSKLASVARVITFGLTQFLHAVPYLIGSALVTGTVLLFESSPVHLLCLIGGALLLVQVLTSYFTIKGLEVGNRIFDEEARKANAILGARLMLEGHVEQLGEKGEVIGKDIVEAIDSARDRVLGRIEDIYTVNEGRWIWNWGLPTPQRDTDAENAPTRYSWNLIGKTWDYCFKRSTNEALPASAEGDDGDDSVSSDESE